MRLSFNPASVTPSSEPSLFTTEESLWPLVVVKFGPGGTLQELEKYLETRMGWLERGEPHLYVIDARTLQMPPVHLRQRYTDWLRQQEALLRQWTLGTAYIIQSPEVRMMMSIIRHLAPMTTPFVVTATLPPAVAWAAARLQEAGLSQAAARIRAHYAVPAS